MLLELTPTQCERLHWAIQSGEFDDFDVVDSEIIDAISNLSESIKEITSQEVWDKVNKTQNSIGLEQSNGGHSINPNTPFGIEIKNNTIRFVKLSEICYLKSKDNLTLIYLVDRTTIDSIESLNTIEEKLPSKYFFRCNLKYIINFLNVIDLEVIDDNFSLKMKCDTNISISKSRHIDLNKFIKDYKNYS